MIRFNHWLLLAFTTLVIASCGSTPSSDHYLLSGPDGVTPSRQTPAIGVGPITIPEYLNRNSMVYNRQGNKLDIAHYSRWAEPLEDGVSRVLALNLATILDTEDVQTYPWTQRRAPTYAVAVRILELDANAQRARLVAEWRLRERGEDAEDIRRIAQLEQAMPGELSAENVALAYSELLASLSQKIADLISEDINKMTDSNAEQ
ncbi:MAG: PqiC family protein [Halioglobus sp.]